MATITTHLLVSGPSRLDGLSAHDLFGEYGFEERGTHEAGPEHLPAAKFVLKQPLEEAQHLEEEVRRFSTDVPDATVILCEVEERFDQVERLQIVVFRDGKRGGDVEHGYVFNVGPD
jgi:hypothetical protein